MIAVLGLTLLGIVSLRGDVTNRWVNAGDGYWDVEADWSAGVAPSNNHLAYITNAGSKTVTIDSMTSGSASNTMTLRSLTLSASGGATNTLALTTSGTAVPLSVSNLVVDTGGFLRISNGYVRASDMSVDGRVALTHGSSLLVVTGSTIWSGRVTVGDWTGSGEINQSKGTMISRTMYLGSSTNTSGRLILSGGTNTVLSTFSVAQGAYSGTSATGLVVVTGGLLSTPGEILLGGEGIGQVAISNGTWRGGDVTFADGSVGRGTLLVAGGSAVLGSLTMGGGLSAGTNAEARVVVCGGELITTGAVVYVGSASGPLRSATLAVSNGVWQGDSLTINGAGNGSVTLVGGTTVLRGTVNVSTDGYARKTDLLLSGGELYMTNSDSRLNVNDTGTVVISNGYSNLGYVDVSPTSYDSGRLVVAGGTNVVSFLRPGGLVSVLGGFLSVTGNIPNGFTPGYLLFDGGRILVNGGSLAATRAVLTSGGGLLVVSNGTVVFDDVNLDHADALKLHGGSTTLGGGTVSQSGGVGVGTPGRSATLRFVGDVTTFSDAIMVGPGAGATGQVVVAGGALITSSWAPLILGSNGVGGLTVSNGYVTADEAVYVGSGAGGRGTFVALGGTNSFNASANYIGSGEGSTGVVVLSGGRLTMADSRYSINVLGNEGFGQLTVSNGVARLGNLLLASGSNAVGNLSLVGGNTALLSLTATSSAASVSLAGGSLSITNGSVIANGQAFAVGSAGRSATLVLASVLAGATNRFEDGLQIAGVAGSTGTVVVSDGELWVTNADLHVGDTGVGALTQLDGLIRANVVRVGANSGSVGALTVAGGTNLIASFLTVARYDGSTGSVLVSGGQLVITNDMAYVGNQGMGTLTVSNGTWLSEGVRVGSSAGSRGALTLAGGTSLVSSNLWVGYAAGTTGSVLMLGGALVTTNQGVTLGSSGRGEMVFSGGTWQVSSLLLGQNSGATGVFTVAANTMAVTNAAGSGTLEVRRGSLILGGGSLKLDTLLATNTAGAIRLNDGSLSLWGSVVDNGSRLSLGAAGGEVLLQVLGGTNRFEDGIELAGVAGSTGTVWLSGASLLVTNNNTYVGLSGIGTFNVSNGIWSARDVTVGRNAASLGTVTLLGGTNTFSSYLSLASLEESTGVVLVTGGRLVVTNNTTYVGNLGVGRFTVSNGTWLAREVSVGAGAGSAGAILVAGGSSWLSSNLWIASAAGTTGTLVVAGGTLVTTNQGTLVGNSGFGQAVVSGGIWRTSALLMGQNPGATGNVEVVGGDIILTNAARTASLEVRRGSLGLSGGTVTTDRLLATNGAGALRLDDGTLSVGEALVANGSRVSVGGAGGQATMWLLRGTNRFEDGLELGAVAGADGTLWLAGGTLLVTNANTYIGTAGVGRMTVSNGTWNARDVTVGRDNGSSGSLLLLDGTNVLSSYLSIGSQGGDGAVVLVGDRLVVTNDTVFVANEGSGRMTVSNGAWLAREVLVGAQAASHGTMVLAGGSSFLSSNLWVGNAAAATGTVVLTGGELVATNMGMRLGVSGRGLMTVSGGTWRASSVLLGQNSGATGILGVAGGTVVVTNSSGSSVLELRRGSLALNGGSTILDRLLATNAAGTLDFNGGALSSRGTVVSNGAAFSVGDSASVASFNLLGGTHAFQNGLAVSPNATVSGWGTVVGVLGNTGAVTTAGGELRLLGAVQGPGSWHAASGDTLSFVRGGTVAGFVSTGATVRVEGSLTNTGAISNPNGLILVGPDGSNGLLNVTGGSVDGGTIVVKSSGTMKVAVAVDTMSSFVTNQGTFQPFADFFTLSGGFRNEVAFTSRNAQVIQVLNNFGNSGAVVLDTNSMLRVNGFGGQPQSGQITLRNGAILQSLSLWTNSGTLTVAKGAMVAGGLLQNQSVIEGAGYVSAALGNRSGGAVRATNGTLTLGGIVTNFAGGTLAASPNAELALNNDLVNQGTMNPQGGSINLPYLTLTNSGTLSGFGTYRAGNIINGGLASFSGGLTDIEAGWQNLAWHTTRVTSASVRFFGAVSNLPGGIFKNTSGSFTFYDTFYNAGLYASDPATNVFSGDVVIGESGAISGGAGDVFQLWGDLTVLNSNGLDIAGATLSLGGGGHTLDLAGAPSIGTLALESGASLTLLGADIYVGVLSAGTNQIWTSQTIFYDQGLNPGLGGQFLNLTGGGSLAPVPEPGVFGLVVAAFVLGVMARRRKGGGA